MTTYKRRSFSFPLYPYPRYRTPSSEDLTFTFDDDAHDKSIAENFVLADSPTPGEEFKFSAEPEIQNATVLAEKVRNLRRWWAHNLTDVFSLDANAVTTDGQGASPNQ